MTTLTVTSKGQITIKKDLLRHLGAEPGDQLQVTLLPQGRLEVRAAPAQPMDHFIGVLAGQTQKVASLAEISAAAARGWQGRSR